MLKKVTACLAALLLLTLSLYAQLSEEADVISSGEVASFEEALPDNLQTQHIQWKSINRARGYVIELQVQQNGKWTDAGTWETEVAEFDFRLEPGSYRFRLSAKNAIGKKGNPSDWAEFDIFESTQPFLHRNTFPESSRYNTPVLARSTINEFGKEIITVHALNCYTDDTVFTLVPSRETSGAFRALEEQKEVVLPVTGSEPDRHIVHLSVDWSQIVPGYYSLVVKNGTNETDSLDVLVLTNRIPQFTLTGTEHNTTFNAECLDLTRDDGLMTFDASGIQYDTEFTLNPVTDDAKPYPFESGLGRQTVTLSGVTYDDGQMTVQTDMSRVKPGWYEMTAVTPDVGESSTRVLIQSDGITSSLPEITGVSSKMNVEAQTLSLTIQTDSAFFDETNADGFRLYCISEKDEFGENKRILLRMTSAAKNGKSAVFEGTASSLIPGYYAFMLETAESSRIVFVEINSKFSADIAKLTDEEISEWFLVPPTEEMLAARAAALAEAEAAGIKLPEDLPAFNSNPFKKWSWTAGGSFPAEVTYDSGTISLSVKNLVGGQKYASDFYMTDSETVAMLRESEGISFQSMVISRNNGFTKWLVSVKTENGDVSIPFKARLKELTQTVVKWEDYGINPESITGLQFTADARNPQDPNWTNKIELFEAKTYSSADPVKQLSIKKPLLFTKVGAYAGVFLSDNSDLLRTTAGLEDVYDDRLGPAGVPSSVFLSIYDADWLTLNAVYRPKGMGSSMMVGSELALSIPNDWFRPYAGYGMSFWGENRWDEAFAGIVFFKYIDFRYSLFKKHVLMAPFGTYQPYNPEGDVELWYADWLQIGLNVPLRKKSVQYLDQATVAKKHHFFTDISLGLDVTDISGQYISYIPDINFGVRALDFKYIALDLSAAVREIPSAAPMNFGSFDTRAEIDIIVPFQLFKHDFALDYALGAGYWFGQYVKGNHFYVSETLGLKLGKNVKLKASFLVYDESLDDAYSLIKDSMVLAPFLFGVVNDYWNIGISLSIPLWN